MTKHQHVRVKSQPKQKDTKKDYQPKDSKRSDIKDKKSLSVQRYETRPERKFTKTDYGKAY